MAPEKPVQDRTDLNHQASEETANTASAKTRNDQAFLFCPYCQSVVLENLSGFCPHCGHRICLA